MAEKLDGSFSGLWTCELCGHTGTDCTCEHFARNWTRGKDKTLSDAEIMAVFWYQDLIVNRAIDAAYPWGTSPEVDLEIERGGTIARLGGIEW